MSYTENSKGRRPYKSTVRAGAAAATRARVVTAAAELLRSEETPASVTMEAVAKAAGVTRLTVYNQFGGRNALFEAVFDECAKQGGLTRIPVAMANPDPQKALSRLIEIFCEFWAADSGMSRLHDEAAFDPEFAAALSLRNERRRKAITVLISRMSTQTRSNADVIDTLFMLTSHHAYRSLSSRKRSAKATCKLITQLCEAAIKTLLKSLDNE
jgi:AcrR family transcriptional regulator